MTWSDDLRGDLVRAAARRPAVRRRHLMTQAATAVAVLALGAGVAAAAIGGGHAGGPAATVQTNAFPARTVPDVKHNPVVAVLDPTNTPGLAGRLAGVLRRHGVKVGRTVVEAWPPAARTQIYATPDHLDEARVIADDALHLPAALVRPPTSGDSRFANLGAQIVVLVGLDLQQGVPAQREVALTGVGVAGASGTIRATRQAISVRIAGLPRSNHYALWIAGRFLGFLAPPAPRQAMHAVASVLGARGEVLVTRERTDHPTHPGDVMLRGDLG